MGRAGYVGDELGAKIIASRLVRDMMRLCFCFERRYAPYPKWFGTAFAQLRCAREMTPLLSAALNASGWQERDSALAAAYVCIARMQNELALVEYQEALPKPFHSRPFSVIHLHTNFSRLLRERIEDPKVKLVAARRPIGSIDQFSDSTDLLSDSYWRPKIRSFYD